MLQEQLAEQRELRLETSCPWQDIFKHTLAYVSSLQKPGCRAPAVEQTSRLPHEVVSRLKQKEYEVTFQRGYIAPFVTCDGKLLLQVDRDGHRFMR